LSAARPLPELRIRPAFEDDIPAIHCLLAELANAIGLKNKFVSSEEDLRRYGFSPRPMFEVMLAEQGTHVAGLCLYFYTYSSWRGAPGVYVQDLVVDPGTRSTGVGRALLVVTARHARSRGATHLRLSVDAANTAAIRFYERLGMRQAGSERIYEASDEAFDALADAT
jgi:ribosomal protein S18 acetylase RimI-like enzyme